MQIRYYLRTILDGIVIFLTIVFLMGYAIYQFIGVSMCGTEIRKINSNHAEVDIISHLGSCGATTGFNYKIYLLKKGRNLQIWDENKAFIDTNDSALDIRWMADNKLIVNIKKDSKVYKYQRDIYINNIKYTIILNDKEGI